MAQAFAPINGSLKGIIIITTKKNIKFKISKHKEQINFLGNLIYISKIIRFLKKPVLKR